MIKHRSGWYQPTKYGRRGGRFHFVDNNEAKSICGSLNLRTYPEYNVMKWGAWPACKLCLRMLGRKL